MRASVNFYGGGRWVIANKALEGDPAKKAAVAEFIEWMTLDCTDSGLQYYIANDKLYSYGVKDTVASRAVMERSDGTMGFLGGQNVFRVFIAGSRELSGNNMTEYDFEIGEIWLSKVRLYLMGRCTHEEAIARFKQEVKEQLGIDAMN